MDLLDPSLYARESAGADIVGHNRGLLLTTPNFKKELEVYVSWMRDLLDVAVIADPGKLEERFLSILRYEYLFWEMAYRGESWPE